MKPRKDFDMKKYMVYVDDGRDCYRIAIPAENEKQAIKEAEGNGEIISIKDVTEKYPISGYQVVEALRLCGFGTIETDFIIRALRSTNIVSEE